MSLPLKAVRLTPSIAKAYVNQFPVSPDIETNLAGAIRQVLNNPGSLIRASLAFQAGRAFELRRDCAESLAIGIEYMHSASLLFDDLPMMDDASERRGHTCPHILYGEAACVLAALAFINRGYALLWSSMAAYSLNSDEAAHRIEHCLGLKGMLTGQSQDLHRPGGWPAHDVLRVSIGKTVALIRLTLVLPAVLSGARKRVVHQLDRIGVYWGLSYQILDDLKDLGIEKKYTGKTTHRDETLGRPNFALAAGMARCQSYLARLLELSQTNLAALTRLHPGLSFLTTTQERLELECSQFLSPTKKQESERKIKI